jgi:hypothetical protein
VGGGAVGVGVGEAHPINRERSRRNGINLDRVFILGETFPGNQTVSGSNLRDG